MRASVFPLCVGRRLMAGLCAGTILGLSTSALANDCVVTDWALARGIAAGAPVERGLRFSVADGRVHAYVRLNCTRVDGPVTFRFQRNGKNYAAVRLPVRPAAGWRTWASVRALPGNWRVTLEIEGRRLLDDAFAVSR